MPVVVSDVQASEGRAGVVDTVLQACPATRSIVGEAGVGGAGCGQARRHDGARCVRQRGALSARRARLGVDWERSVDLVCVFGPYA